MAKTGKKVNRTPDLECPVVVDMRTPYLTEASGKIAAHLVKFREAYDEWRKEYRKHVTSGGKKTEAPIFDSKHFFKVRGAVTMAAAAKIAAQLAEGEEVELGPTYNPVLIEAIHAMNASSIYRGRGTKKPSKWDDAELGEWRPGDVLSTKLPRRCHAEKAEDLVENPETDILQVGSSRYVVGDGTLAGCAPMRVWGTERGNYRSLDTARKSLSIAGNKADVTDVVFRIEDRPNNGDNAVTVKGFSYDIGELVFLPGQAMTPGYLYRGDDRLSAKDIRKLGDDTKGVAFKSLMGDPLVCKAVSWDDNWKGIQEIEGSKGLKVMRERPTRGEETASPQDRTWHNAKVTSRVNPSELHPFGLRAAQCGMVPYIVMEPDGDASLGVVIGARSNWEYNVGVNEAKANAAETVDATEEKPKRAAKPKAEKAEKPKAEKAEKSKRKAKPAAEKAEKPKRQRKPKPAAVEPATTEEPAAPVEAEAEEVETKESETTAVAAVG